MAKYIVYTYQFSPIRQIQRSFFDTSESGLMACKQEIFQNLFENDLTFSNKGKLYEHMILHNQDGVIVLRIANNKHVNYEERFRINTQPHFPSVNVIIDNRHDVQHIAIEERTTAFLNTNMVADILQSTFQQYLKQHHLHIVIQREFQSYEFWDAISQYPNGVTMVRFKFSYPNLPRVTEKINDMISNASKNVGSQSTTFEFDSESENLALSKENETLSDLVDASASSGNVITFKARGVKAHQTTGTTTKSFEIDDLEMEIKPDLWNNTGNKLIEKLNSLFR